MLNSISLSRIRGSSARWLSARCSIERDIDTLDELGSPVQGREIVAENVPCRIVKNKSFSASTATIIGSAEALTETYKIAIPSNYDLDIDYYITSNAITYEVVSIEAALTDGIFAQAIITRHR